MRHVLSILLTAKHRWLSSARNALCVVAISACGLLGTSLALVPASAADDSGQLEHDNQSTNVHAAPTTAELTLPLRAAFYYPWFPEAWTQQGISPYTKYTPSLGYYDSSSATVIRAHIASMQYGNIAAGIASWWGQGTRTDTRVNTILSATAGTGFKWSLYYEPEGQGNPPVAQINADLLYIQQMYAADPSYLRLGGRFVVFVYADATDGCEMVDRWKQANTVNAYVVLKVFAGYKTCPNQPDGWHQYAPAVAADNQGSYSYSISPGFDKVGEATRLTRDLARWRQNVRNMAASSAAFQLVTTFNEWGEGTAVESAAEWATGSGNGAYLDALHNNGAEPVPSVGGIARDVDVGALPAEHASSPWNAAIVVSGLAVVLVIASAAAWIYRQSRRRTRNTA
jgi:glycosyl hydrolase family 99